jgi:hypothetical protein
VAKKQKPRDSLRAMDKGLDRALAKRGQQTDTFSASITAGVRAAQARRQSRV